MGTVPPVRVDTLRALGPGQSLGDDVGALAISVNDALGKPVSGIQVAAGGLKVTTGVDGCAVLLPMMPGSYVVKAGAEDYVGEDTNQSVTLPNVVVKEGQFTRDKITYNTAITASLTPQYQAGFQLPQESIRVTMRSSYVGQKIVNVCPASDGEACTTGTYPRIVTNLYPGIYDFWFGTCQDARSPVPAEIKAKSGQTNVTLPLGTAIVKVVSTQGNPVSGASIIAEHDPDMRNSDAATGCYGGESFTFPATDANGEARVVLPYGTWNFSVNLDGMTSVPGTVAAGSTPTVQISNAVTASPSSAATTTPGVM